MLIGETQSSRNTKTSKICLVREGECRQRSLMSVVDRKVVALVRKHVVNCIQHPEYVHFLHSIERARVRLIA